MMRIGYTALADRKWTDIISCTDWKVHSLDTFNLAIQNSLFL